jgi:hypothetical protein
MILRICFFIFFVISLQTAGIAQESGGKSDPPKKDQSIKSKRKQRQADKKKWKEDRKNKRLEEKKIRDHHKRIQTKEVRKRMKKSKGKAIRNNTHQREPFFQRMFQKKRGKGSRQPKEKAPKVQQ